MKAIILAAGQGSRLSLPADHLPKPLTQLANGLSILELQLKTLAKEISLHDLLIVVGYHKEEIMDRFPDLLYVYNPDYAAENTAKSLLRALHKCQDDVLWLNGDVVFHPSALKAVLAARRTSMLVNEGPVGEEEVKYRCDKQGKILEVSKQVAAPQGEALGINFCASKDLVHLKTNLAKCASQDYFEKGIELCIEEGIEVWRVPIASHLCTEIDFPEDLEKANALLQSW